MDKKKTTCGCDCDACGCRSEENTSLLHSGHADKISTCGCKCCDHQMTKKLDISDESSENERVTFLKLHGLTCR